MVRVLAARYGVCLGVWTNCGLNVFIEKIKWRPLVALVLNITCNVFENVMQVVVLANLF